MTQGESDEEGYVSKIAKKVPAEIAGPVLIAVVFILTSPFILDKLQGEVHVLCYLIFLGIIAFCVLLPISLHSISKYHERETRLLLRSLKELPSTQNVDSIIEREVEEAVISMEEERSEGAEEE